MQAQWHLVLLFGSNASISTLATSFWFFCCSNNGPLSPTQNTVIQHVDHSVGIFGLGPIFFQIKTLKAYLLLIHIMVIPVWLVKEDLNRHIGWTFWTLLVKPVRGDWCATCGLASPCRAEVLAMAWQGESNPHRCLCTHSASESRCLRSVKSSTGSPSLLDILLY